MNPETELDARAGPGRLAGLGARPVAESRESTRGPTVDSRPGPPGEPWTLDSPPLLGRRPWTQGEICDQVTALRNGAMLRDERAPTSVALTNIWTLPAAGA